MVPTPLCQICCIPFDVGRIKKFNDQYDTAIAFYAPGQRRRLDGWRRGSIDQEYEDKLASMAAAKTEESREDLFGGDEVCRARSCRAIGIAPEGDPLGHYAGPNCHMNHGYNGYKITPDEMEGRTRLCCLRAKPEVWFANADVLDQQGESRLCYLMEEGEWTNLSNESQANVPLEGKADLPMHPTCYELFKRLSLRRLGNVDMDALWMFRDKYENLNNGMSPKSAWTDDNPHTWTRFDGIPQPTDLGIVLRGEEWSRLDVRMVTRYYHEPGTEYLAADPVTVPGLDERIATGSQGRVSDIAFSSPRASPQTEDVFSVLPVEIRKMIVEALPRKDVVNLRIASSKFTELPQSYFHHLIKAEMPWVWEIDSLPAQEVNWHGLWSRLSAADGGSYVDEKKRVWARRQLRELTDRTELTMENDETGEDQAKMYKQAMETGKEHIMKQFRVLNKMQFWGNDKKATELRGLRNRRRIWADIDGILNRVEGMRSNDELH